MREVKAVVVDVRPHKTALRERYKKMRREMDEHSKMKADRLIAERLFKTWQYRENDILFTYVSLPIEVDTKKIIEVALKDGKKVAVPRCIKNTREMDFYFINSFDDLEKRTFGVLEPVPEKCEKVTDISQGICIVPALSFDLNGYRLGYGGGYYDRFLAKFNGDTVGICYSSCIRREMIRSRFDRPVQLVVTDKYIRRTYSEHRQ